MSAGNGRRKWTSSEKLRIVLAGMQTGEIAELCRREGINPTQYYSWKKQLVDSADAVFNVREQKRSHKEIKQEHALQRMKSVIAEITAENLELKKTLSD